MSLCYDFEKWTMITLVAVAVSLTISLLLINLAHGQSSSPFANCIYFKSAYNTIALNTDDDCNEEQFIQAVAYYKTHGYPIEEMFTDMGFRKYMTLESEQFDSDTR